MYKLPQPQPVLLIQAGDAGTIEGGEVGSHGDSL